MRGRPRPRRVLVAACEGHPATALGLAPRLAGPEGEVVLAAMVVMPLTQPLGAAAEEPLRRGVALLDAGERLLERAPCGVDSRLVRCRSFARGACELAGRESFDLVIAEGAHDPATGGLKAGVITLLDRCPLTTAVVLPGPAPAGDAPDVLVAARDLRPPAAALPLAARLVGTQGRLIAGAVEVVPVTEALEPAGAAGRSGAVAAEAEREASRLGVRAEGRPKRARSFARGVLDLLAADPAGLLVLEYRRDQLRPAAPESQLLQLWDRAGVTIILVRPRAGQAAGSKR